MSFIQGVGAPVTVSEGAGAHTVLSTTQDLVITGVTAGGDTITLPAVSGLRVGHTIRFRIDTAVRYFSPLTVTPAGAETMRFQNTSCTAWAAVLEQDFSVIWDGSEWLVDSPGRRAWFTGDTSGTLTAGLAVLIVPRLDLTLEDLVTGDVFEVVDASQVTPESGGPQGVMLKVTGSSAAGYAWHGVKPSALGTVFNHTLGLTGCLLIEGHSTGDNFLTDATQKELLWVAGVGRFISKDYITSQTNIGHTTAYDIYGGGLDTALSCVVSIDNAGNSKSSINGGTYETGSTSAPVAYGLPNYAVVRVGSETVPADNSTPSMRFQQACVYNVGSLSDAKRDLWRNSESGRRAYLT